MARAYRWGEDGIAGISDDQAKLCFALSLWNGQDDRLKERLFGLTNNQGNHGEDVKEYYYYLDSTPTHSYMRYFYKYPQAAFPYQELVEENAQRGFNDPEYELIDTGIFDEDKYFDVEVEYAKVFTRDMVIAITATNRCPEAAPLHVLPTLWFRNTWSSVDHKQRTLLAGNTFMRASAPEMNNYWLYCAETEFGPAELLYTDNETNNARVFNGQNHFNFTKDGINNHIVSGEDSVNANKTGTKVAAHYELMIPAGESRTVWLRLTDRMMPAEEALASEVLIQALQQARQEADSFYEAVTPPNVPQDQKRIVR